ncbi:hypothetical protein A6A40_22970 (plasmid) [Azospirillum humicireducens]|uniref:Transposase n=1 Tax=Azospirillum humicireducens TaxID=1226968 RepID=A0A2R4VU16_9PROT|nr:hypothetical protein A6A40_22970 [Azospirillum humicireducens]
MTKQASPKYAPEVRELAVRMVFEHEGEHASLFAAISEFPPRARTLSLRENRRGSDPYRLGKPPTAQNPGDALSKRCLPAAPDVSDRHFRQGKRL